MLGPECGSLSLPCVLTLMAASSLTEDRGLGSHAKAAQHSAAQRLCRFLALLKVSKKHPEDLWEGGKVSDTDCLPNTQVLTSCFQHWLPWPWFLFLDKGKLHAVSWTSS